MDSLKAFKRLGVRYVRSFGHLTSKQVILMDSDTDAPSSPQFRRSHRVGAHDLEGAGISMQYRITNSRGIEVRSMFSLWQFHRFNGFCSGSMEPAFYRGDLLFLTNPASEQYLTGDITVYKIPGADIPIVHRVIETHDVVSKGCVPDTSYLMTIFRQMRLTAM